MLDEEDIQDAESTPLEQAEVYIAFGRYDQAREALEASLKENSQQPELEAKLLEVREKIGQHMAEAAPSSQSDTRWVIPTPDGSKKPSGKLILLLLLAGLITVGGVLYYKHGSKAIGPKPDDPVKVVAKSELQACTEERADLQNEVTQLKAQLKDIQAATPVAPAAPKKSISIFKKTPAPAVSPQAKEATNVPQAQPWNSTPVPDPVLKWLQHD